MTTIAVTGLNATDNPAPGMAVVRCLREAGAHRFVGLAYDALDTCVHSPGLLDETYLVPYPFEGEQVLLERLADILERRPFEALLPNLDSELIGYARLAGQLQELGVRTLLPSPSVLKLRSKLHLAEFCQQHGFLTPRTRVVRSAEEVVEVGQEWGWPVVVKGVFHGARVAHHAGEAAVWFEQTRREWGLPLLVQEYLCGEEYDVAAVGSRAGTPLGWVAMRKLRITAKGTAWAAITVAHQGLLGKARALMERLAWVGPVEFEFLLDSVTERFYLLEINPRFPSWIYLSAGAGLNLPALALDELLGRDPRCQLDYQSGKFFVRHALDVVGDLDDLESLAMKGELIRAAV
ncbi:MAG: ATP-grasp domain-containing protein [Candidatus Eremiobacteraeota bacterium]|nr:ATP-grasp domain-containing protein [Candidatus Eremiobacteraeota bacterium]